MNENTEIIDDTMPNGSFEDFMEMAEEMPIISMAGIVCGTARHLWNEDTASYPGTQRMGRTTTATNSV